jgi:cytochrome oxidase Cu insertion factor (SCO1/SenC/PrrC family)
MWHDRLARAGRAARVLLLGAALVAMVGAAPAGAHETADGEEVYIKGTFSPAFTPPAAGTYELPRVKRVPAFVLRDTAGRRVDTGALMRGKVAVVSFIYTACADRLGCPLASGVLRELQVRILAERLQKRAILVTISLDPERDTPVHLGRYARAFDPDPALWRFLTAPSEREGRRVFDAYGQDRARTYDDRGRFTGLYRHVLKVFLVDADGYVRNIYSTGFLVPQVVINDIKTLLGAGTTVR